VGVARVLEKLKTSAIIIVRGIIWLALLLSLLFNLLLLVIAFMEANGQAKNKTKRIVVSEFARKWSNMNPGANAGTVIIPVSNEAARKLELNSAQIVDLNRTFKAGSYDLYLMKIEETGVAIYQSVELRETYVVHSGAIAQELDSKFEVPVLHESLK